MVKKNDSKDKNDEIIVESTDMVYSTIEDKETGKENIISAELYLKIKQIKHWEIAGMLMFAEKNVGKKLQTLQEWETFFRKY